MTDHLLRLALDIAASGLPVLPLLSTGGSKRPVGNCPDCTGQACGGRPNMKAAGRCACPAPCHAWAAATTNPLVLRSPQWARGWRQAAAVGYHPAGAGLTVVDLDNAAAVDWARTTLPPTRTVATTRGEHWIYTGTMSSSNGVRPGVDIKSVGAHVRWRGWGNGVLVGLPTEVQALVVKQPAAVRPVSSGIAAPAGSGGGVCRHRAPAYLERGIAMAEQRITEAHQAIHHTVYATFLAVLSAHGRCGCLTDTHVARLFTAAQAKGESPRHCTDAWTNARSSLGL